MCQQLNFSDRLLKHLAPLWGEGVSDLTPILEKCTTPTGHTEVHILNTKLKSGDQKQISGNLEVALSTLRTTLILPTTQEHRKLPKTTTYKTKKIHTTWLRCINPETLLLCKQSTYESITSHISTGRGMHKRQRATHIGDTYMTPSDTIFTQYDVIEIQDHKHLNNHTTYLVSQWSPEIFTQKQINACTN